LREEKIQEEFFALKVEGVIVVAYGLILPEAILNFPLLGCLNVHASLLPRWRGAAPIQRAILAGDPQTGITIMKMDKGLDTGPILLKKVLPLSLETNTFKEVHDALALLGAEALTEVLKEYSRWVPTAQPEEGVTYAAKLTKEEGQVNWLQPAYHIDRQVRALNPWPGVWFDYQGQKIKILKGELVKDKTGPAGIVLDSSLTIACGKEAFQPSLLQRAGGRPLEREEFLRGFPIPMNTCLIETSLNPHATL